MGGVMARTTKDLIDELRAEGERFQNKTADHSAVALVVAFENASEFVWNSDRNPLQKLRSLIEKCGEPVGLLGWIVVVEYDEESSKRARRMYSRALQEYASEQWVDNFLSALCTTCGEQIAKEKGIELGRRIGDTELN